MLDRFKLLLAGGAILALVLMWSTALYQKGKERARADKAEAQVVKVTSDLKTCQSNLVTLSDAVGRQNRAVLDMKAERDAALKRSEELSRQAAREAKKHEQAIARLRALKPGPNECESARQLLAEEVK